MLHVVPAGILSFPSGGYVPAGGLYLDGSLRKPIKFKTPYISDVEKFLKRLIWM